MNSDKMTAFELSVTVPFAQKKIIQDDAIAESGSLPRGAADAAPRGFKRCYSPTVVTEGEDKPSAFAVHTASVTPEPQLLQKIMKPSFSGEISDELFEVVGPAATAIKASSIKIPKICPRKAAVAPIAASSLGYEPQVDYGYEQPKFPPKIPSLQEMRLYEAKNRDQSNKRRRFNRRCSVTKFSLHQVAASAKAVGTGTAAQAQRMTIHMAAQKVLQLLRDEARQDGPISW